MFKLTFPELKKGQESPYVLEKISPSMITQYMECPLAFYYNHIAKIQLPQDNIHLLFGSAVHKAIEEMYKGTTELDKAYEVFDTVFKKSELHGPSKEKHAEYKKLGREMIKNYFEIHPELDKIYGLNNGSSEHYFRKKIINPISGEESRIPISGIVDRLSFDKKIIEYKTSSKPWDPKEARARVQTRMYNLWYLAEKGELPEETLYFILLKKYKTKDTDEVLQVIRYKATEEDLAEMFEELDLVLDKIESGLFERPMQGHPFFCDCKKYEEYLGLTT